MLLKIFHWHQETAYSSAVFYWQCNCSSISEWADAWFILCDLELGDIYPNWSWQCHDAGNLVCSVGYPTSVVLYWSHLIALVNSSGKDFLVFLLINFWLLVLLLLLLLVTISTIFMSSVDFFYWVCAVPISLRDNLSCASRYCCQ